MVVDTAALATELDANAKYNTDVTGGHNGKILASLLVESDALQPRWRPVRRDDFLSAIAGETLTTAQEARVQTYTQDGQSVPMQKEGIRTWVLANMLNSIANLERVGTVKGRPIDAFLGEDDDTATLRDLRPAVAQVNKSYINQPESRPPRVEAIDKASTDQLVEDSRSGSSASSLAATYGIDEVIVERIIAEHPEDKS